jgi:hypothetical protein
MGHPVVRRAWHLGSVERSLGNHDGDGYAHTCRLAKDRTVGDQSFDPNARYSEKAASDGQIKVLVIGNPLGKEAPYISFNFPDDLLDRYDALPAPDRKRTEDRIIAAARAICCPTIRVGVVTLKRWALSSSMD